MYSKYINSTTQDTQMPLYNALPMVLITHIKRSTARKHRERESLLQKEQKRKASVIIQK